ncbi:hypothetical protein HETIRDRAFT_307456, partial [Heterobasidion irregulare TC 32-1]
DSVLILLSLYPGDFALQSYLRDAIHDGILSLGVFVTTFLLAARSPDLHDPATLDMLCRIAIESHFSSGLLLSSSSVISFTESPDGILTSIRNALELLKTAHSLPISHFHRLIESVGYLVTLLTSSFTDISKVPRAQAMACAEEIREAQQMFSLSQDVREALAVFAHHLDIWNDGSSTPILEMPPMHTVQPSLGKGDILAPGTESDVVTCSLMLYHLVSGNLGISKTSQVSNRARDFGSGNDAHAAALIVATFRATSWTLTKFYTRLLAASISCLFQDIQSRLGKGPNPLWRAFIVGRLPRLLLLSGKAIEADGSMAADPHTAVRDALSVIFLSQPKNPHLMQYDGALDMLSEPENSRAPSFARDFTQQLLAVGLVDQMFAARVDATLANDNSSRLQIDAREAGVDLESYLTYRISSENGADDTSAFLERVYQDFRCHPVFSEIVRKRFTALATSGDVESLGYLAKILYMNEAALDLVSLHVKISELTAHALVLLEDYDCETVGDPGTAVSHLGDVVIFLQWTLARYNLSTTLHILGEKTLDPGFLRVTDNVRRIEDLSSEQAAAFNSWFKALFDKNSEGIEDGVLRSTRPKMLLMMAATLCSHAITACTEHKIDVDVLANGFSFFTGPLLSWTLVGVVKTLVREMKQTRYQSPHHLNILRTLILSPTCPRSVLRLCGHDILRLLSDPQLAAFIPETANLPAIQAVINEALGLRDDSECSRRLNAIAIVWADQPRHAIQTAFSMIQLGKAPSLDVVRCLAITPPTRFLHTFWFELSMATSLSIDTLRRVALYVLAIPRTPNIPPLLPLFLHNVFPSILDTMDRQPTGAQSMHIELLAGIVSSAVMTALHLERAVLTTTGEQRFILGEPSSAMARRLAADLRHRKHNVTAKLIAQRLTSSATFVASFPVFKMEI